MAFINNNEYIDEPNKIKLLLNRVATIQRITNITLTIINCLTVIPEMKLFAHATQPNLYSVTCTMAERIVIINNV